MHKNTSKRPKNLYNNKKITKEGNLDRVYFPRHDRHKAVGRTLTLTRIQVQRPEWRTVVVCTDED